MTKCPWCSGFLFLTHTGHCSGCNAPVAAEYAGITRDELIAFDDPDIWLRICEAMFVPMHLLIPERGSQNLNLARLQEDVHFSARRAS